VTFCAVLHTFGHFVDNRKNHFSGRLKCATIAKRKGGATIIFSEKRSFYDSRHCVSKRDREHRDACKRNSGRNGKRGGRGRVFRRTERGYRSGFVFRRLLDR